MGEKPSFRNVSNAELQIGIDHVQGEHPHVPVYRETLREIFDEISRRMLTERGYVEVRRQEIIKKGFPKGTPSYEAYKAAVAKISGIRRSARCRFRKRQGAPRSRPLVDDNDESQPCVVIGENGPMTEQEIQEAIALFGFPGDYAPSLDEIQP